MAHAQSASESASTGHTENGVPIDRIIATVAKKTGKKFVLDPRVRGDIVIIGQEPASVSYNDLLTILAMYDYFATETGGYVTILPDANARQGRSPILSGKESYPDAEVVSVVITPKNVPAAQLVPILRPLIPQYGHLAAVPCVNKLLLVDRFSNVKRLQAIIEALDVGEPFKPEKCEYPLPSSSK
jgi:general secretion pathway protein D